jgi:hypothetical protein
MAGAAAVSLLNPLERPTFRVVPNRTGWGVQAQWPSSGPWTKWQIWPRWVWHGPFGFHDFIFPTEEDAWEHADGCTAQVRKMKLER